MKAKKNGRRPINFVTMLVLCMAMMIVVSGINPEILTMSPVGEADVLLLDPGHGGFDGGAESAEGTAEKDINLAIAMYIKELAQRDGWKVVMTREEDKGLEGNIKGAIRSKKTEDIKRRREIIRTTAPTLTVSIHLNSFREDKSVRGAQVFYPSSDIAEEKDAVNKSKLVAEAIQKSLINSINDGTNRKAMEKSGVGILKENRCPIVLVECGFLSNNEEAKLLEKNEYQCKIAEAVYSGIMDALDKSGKNLESTRIIDSLQM